MTDQGDLLARIAAALERVAPAVPDAASWTECPAYVWHAGSARGVATIDAPPLDLLRGIDKQKRTVVENVARLGKGAAAHDMLLWGARGMGKSALIRSAVAAVQREDAATLALVQVGSAMLESVPDLFESLREVDRCFLIFVDDLGFAEEDAIGPRQMRSWLEGGVEARPANVRLAVTSNRRAILSRSASQQEEQFNPRDALDDSLALADRFGIAIGFHNCSQDEYLAIVSGYAQALGLDWQEREAIEWALQRGSRSGRAAWQFVTELAGRAGISV